MESSTPIFSYKGTKLDLNPVTSASIVSIFLPQPSASSRTTQRRSQIAEIPVAEDDVSFRRHHLASAASIYHRVSHSSPRSFLWRVLEDGKVLSIQAVDVSRSKNTTDANITLRLTFPYTIKPGSVALSDSNEHDVLNVFVLVDSKLVYTLSLRPEYFRKPTSTEDNVLDWCKIYASPGLHMKRFHRLVALNPNELLISLDDGSLLKLARNFGNDGKPKLA